ncbi:hypothetical protein P691DRAFT_786051 [Macrolepiota fuliginosa MF-IS2]|uniref:F-box domain-containing protein n=1 Tax=Macrolepiota fuliginosa MF-IS2 TaxID=1400762 RepID=A0A9P6BY61_9AGAR|nr:hypothetical protein P691DRAFT_786051 [Macrolepiota fuliginosa MF-IS2]
MTTTDILSLGRDITGCIFTLLRHFPDTDATAIVVLLSHVCRSWRGISYNMPELWTSVQLFFNNVRSDDWQPDQCHSVTHKVQMIKLRHYERLAHPLKIALRIKLPSLPESLPETIRKMVHDNALLSIGTNLRRLSDQLKSITLISSTPYALSYIAKHLNSARDGPPSFSYVTMFQVIFTEDFLDEQRLPSTAPMEPDNSEWTLIRPFHRWWARILDNPRALQPSALRCFTFHLSHPQVGTEDVSSHLLRVLEEVKGTLEQLKLIDAFHVLFSLGTPRSPSVRNPGLPVHLVQLKTLSIVFSSQITWFEGILSHLRTPFVTRILVQRCYEHWETNLEADTRQQVKRRPLACARLLHLLRETLSPIGGNPPHLTYVLLSHIYLPHNSAALIELLLDQQNIEHLALHLPCPYTLRGMNREISAGTENAQRVLDHFEVWAPQWMFANYYLDERMRVAVDDFIPKYYVFRLRLGQCINETITVGCCPRIMFLVGATQSMGTHFWWRLPRSKEHQIYHLGPESLITLVPWRYSRVVSDPAFSKPGSGLYNCSSGAYTWHARGL